MNELRTFILDAPFINGAPLTMVTEGGTGKILAEKAGDDDATMEDVLKAAIAVHGKPDWVMMDNGRDESPVLDFCQSQGIQVRLWDLRRKPVAPFKALSAYIRRHPAVISGALDASSEGHGQREPLAAARAAAGAAQRRIQQRRVDERLARIPIHPDLIGRELPGVRDGLLLTNFAATLLSNHRSGWRNWLATCALPQVVIWMHQIIHTCKYLSRQSRP